MSRDTQHLVSGLHRPAVIMKASQYSAMWFGTQTPGHSSVVTAPLPLLLLLVLGLSTAVGVCAATAMVGTAVVMVLVFVAALILALWWCWWCWPPPCNSAGFGRVVDVSGRAGESFVSETEDLLAFRENIQMLCVLCKCYRQHAPYLDYARRSIAYWTTGMAHPQAPDNISRWPACAHKRRGILSSLRCLSKCPVNLNNRTTARNRVAKKMRFIMSSFETHTDIISDTTQLTRQKTTGQRVILRLGTATEDAQQKSKHNEFHFGFCVYMEKLVRNESV